MLLADWIDALGDLPQEAVERAIRERIRSDNRARPLPGEIRARARAFIEQPLSGPRDEYPFGEVVSPDELERRREMSQRVAAEFPMLKRVPQCIDERTGEDADL